MVNRFVGGDKILIKTGKKGFILSEKIQNIYKDLPIQVSVIVTDEQKQTLEEGKIVKYQQCK